MAGQRADFAFGFALRTAFAFTGLQPGQMQPLPK
jgi:hypothetical protein